MWGSCRAPEPAAGQKNSPHPCPCRAPLCPQEGHRCRPRIPTAPHPQVPAPPWTTEPLLSFVPAAPRDRRCPRRAASGAGAPAPRSLLDPADGLDLARLRVGPPLPHVLVLARGAVALQEVLEAPVPRVLRADPPATEQRAAVARGGRHRGALTLGEGPGSCQSTLGPAACPGARSWQAASPGYSRAGADKEGAHGAAAPAQGGQRGAVVAHLCPLALEVLLLKEHQPAPPVVLRPRRARLWHCHPVGGRPAGGAGTGALTAQAMGRKEHILSTW